jgi:iron complex outermembrane receptor protein
MSKKSTLLWKRIRLIRYAITLKDYVSCSLLPRDQVAKMLWTAMLVLLSHQLAHGQISGRLTNTVGKPISYATASLIKATDSTLVRSTFSREDGIYRLDSFVPGKYIVRLSSIGYKTFYSSTFELTAKQLQKDLGTQLLDETNKPLNEIVIRANRPVFQQRADGTVVNLENSLISKGSSVLEVLERSPGVVIDHQNSGLMLNGKSGVVVLLNGKPLRMAVEQVVTMLAAISANEIKSIELLTNPSASYDAEGNGGLINIITTKNNLEGTHGSTSLTTGYGYGEKVIGSVNLNHRFRNLSLSGAYTYSHDKSYSDFHALGREQEPLLGGLAASDFLSIDRALLNNHQMALNADARLNDKLTIGGSINYNLSHTLMETVNRGIYQIGPDHIYRLNAIVKGLNHWRNLSTGIYADWLLNKDKKLSLNIDHINYSNNFPTDVNSTFLDQNGIQAGNNDTLFSPRSKGVSATQIHLWAPKIDYAWNINSTLSLTAGLKVTQTRTNSTSAIQSLVNEQFISRPEAVNTVLMNEEIAAFYTTLKAQLNDRMELMTGLRYEHTDTKMNNQLIRTNRQRSFGVWFPNIIVSSKLDNSAEWVFSYAKRISRPSYSDLASYITYNGPSSVNTGNPQLLPTITHNLKLGYTHHGYTFAALWSRDNNPIARYQIVYTADKKQMAVSPQNMIYQNNLIFQANLPIPLTSWWTTNYNMNGGWHRFELDYTPKAIDKKYFSYNMTTSQLFKLPGRYAIEISGYYNSAFYNGSKKVDGYGAINAGVKKVFKNNNGSLQLSVSDLLRSTVVRSYFGALTTEAFDLKSQVDFHPESSQYRIFKLTYSKTFGSNVGSNQQKRDKTMADEAERIAPK